MKLWQLFVISTYPPFWLTSLIYAEKFEFENPAIMEDKQCKEIERILAMAKKRLFLLLDDNTKHIYKVKINNIQGYDPYQIKKEELSGDISQFLQWHNLFNYFLFLLSPLTKEELKRYESLECYNHFASGCVKEVKTKLFLNYLLKLHWLLDGSVRNVFLSSFYCSILIRCIVFITKIR